MHVIQAVWFKGVRQRRGHHGYVVALTHHTSSRINMCAYAHTYTYTYAYTTYREVSACVYTLYICLYIYIYAIHTYIHIHTFTYIYIFIYTQFSQSTHYQQFTQHA